MELSTAAAFNGLIAANVVHALSNWGTLDLLANTDRPMSTDDLARNSRVDRELCAAALRAAGSCGLVRHHPEGVVLTDTGRAFHREAGLFTWAVGGYGEIMRALPDLGTGMARYGVDFHRHEAAVAKGSGLAGSRLMADKLADAWDRSSFSRFVDLGCGDASRLVEVLSRRPGTTGIGVDVSADACTLARDRVAAAGLTDRVEVRCADAVKLILDADPDSPIDPDVDLIGSFFLLHDLLAAAPEPVEFLRRLRNAFPRARTYLFADTTYRSPAEIAEPTPTFIAGFELLHAVMGVRLWTCAQYEAVFAAAGLSVRERIDAGVPHSYLWVLSPVDAEEPATTAGATHV